jgi:flagellar FliJ protein
MVINMARFKFRLKPIRELRKHIEQEYKDSLARERQILYGLQDEGKRLRDEFFFWSRQYMKNAEAGISPQEAVRINAYIEELNRLMDANEKADAAQSAVVEEARLELIEKMKDRKTLDTLYEKQFSSYTENERYKAERETEEMITSRLSTAI